MFDVSCRRSRAHVFRSFNLSAPTMHMWNFYILSISLSRWNKYMLVGILRINRSQKVYPKRKRAPRCCYLRAGKKELIRTSYRSLCNRYRRSSSTSGFRRFDSRTRASWHSSPCQLRERDIFRCNMRIRISRRSPEIVNSNAFMEIVGKLHPWELYEMYQ